MRKSRKLTAKEKDLLKVMADMKVTQNLIKDGEVGFIGKAWSLNNRVTRLNLRKLGIIK